MRPSEAENFHLERERVQKAVADACANRSRLFSNLRGLCFATSLFLLLYAGAQDAPWAYWASAFALAGFLALVRGHGTWIEKQQHAERRAWVSRNAALRSAGKFQELPDLGKDLVDPSHPYASDLDLLGMGSLFQRLSIAHTFMGRRTLADWLQKFAAPDEVCDRRAAVSHLEGEIEFREQLEAFSLSIVEKRRGGKTELTEGPNPKVLFEYLTSRQSLWSGYRVIAWLLPALTCSLLLLYLLGKVPPWAWLLPLAVQLLVLHLTGSARNEAYRAVSLSEGGFLTYGKIIRTIETMSADGPWLRSRLDRLKAKSNQKRASEELERFTKIADYYALRQNGMVFPFVEAFLLYSLHCSLALESFRRQVGENAEDWFRVIGEIEAIASLATFASDEPDASFPEERDGGASASGLGHPLISRIHRIENDLPAIAPGEALLITGSNMSGKSTFLRALGVNLVLARAGSKVCARSFSVGPATLGTSIRISDSLQTGTSHFFAEVKRMASIMETAETSGPVLFLLDEVLHGTNSRERQIGARFLLRRLLELGSFGILTTHDEQLCELPAHLASRVRQFHFREEVESGTMSFDFRLREGQVRSGNALRLMNSVGLAVPLEPSDEVDEFR